MKYMSLLEVYEVYVVIGGRISLCLLLLDSQRQDNVMLAVSLMEMFKDTEM